MLEHKVRKPSNAKKEAAPSAKGTASALQTTTTIPQTNLIGKALKKTQDGRLRYTMQSVMRSCALKLYVEQIVGFDETKTKRQMTQPDGSPVTDPDTSEVLYETDPGLLAAHTKELLSALSARVKEQDPASVQILMIVHDRDTNHDDFWKPSNEKPHIHIILRFLNDGHQKLSSILSMLGVQFRPGIDDTLCAQHGVESVGDFTEYTMYLMHKTKKAISDGKAPYDITEIVSNISVEDIRHICDGYNRVQLAASHVDFKDWVALDEAAYKAGYELQDFDAWYGSQSFAARSGAKMRTVKESYQRGIKARAEDPEQSSVLRLCVFIQGEPGCGKTYTAVHALTKLGQKTLRCGGGGTGRFDKLQPSHDAIVIDDDTCPRLLTMADNYITQVYRRQSNNPYFCGRYLIITSNLDFEEWVRTCGLSDDQHIEAAISRFYICRMEDRMLLLSSPSKRGTYDEQTERLNMFKEFRRSFNEIAEGYVKDERKVDYFLEIDDIPFC